MMSARLSDAFTDWRQRGRKALIPFFVAGDPAPETTVPLMHKLVSAGADLIELGVPFSDPMADGPTIQRASERALAKGVGLKDVLDMAAEFRQRDDKTPLVLMGYTNCVEVMGWDKFVAAAVASGVDGILLVDLPPEESMAVNELCRRSGLHRIFMVAPTTDDERLRFICKHSSGFLYYVSLKGVTGSDHVDWSGLAGRLRHIVRISPVPLAVGFGIRSAEDAARAAELADAVVVGSALIESMDGLAGEQAQAGATRFISSLRAAVDGRAAPGVAVIGEYR